MSCLGAGFLFLVIWSLVWIVAAEMSEKQKIISRPNPLGFQRLWAGTRTRAPSGLPTWPGSHQASRRGAPPTPPTPPTTTWSHRCCIQVVNPHSLYTTNRKIGASPLARVQIRKARLKLLQVWQPIPPLRLGGRWRLRLYRRRRGWPGWWPRGWPGWWPRPATRGVRDPGPVRTSPGVGPCLGAGSPLITY